MLWKGKICDISVETYFDHFKELNTVNGESKFDEIDKHENLHFNEELNESITDVLKALRALKNGKACANDLILNEFLKTSQELILPRNTRILTWCLRL